MPGVTSGGATGTNGAGFRLSRLGPWQAGYAVAAALFLMACAVNVATKLHDVRSLPGWFPATWEITSTLSSLAFLWIAFAAVDATFARALPWPRAALLHAGAASAFSVLHCLGMWTLRRLVYTAAGVAYGWYVSAGQVFYEYRKDVVTYAVIALIYQGVRRMVQPAEPVAAVPDATQDVAPAFFDIRDGTRLWRVPVGTITAVSSAGNYVEFLLSGGEKRLMRGTLSGVQAVLAPHGFIRVHRSWLVNRATVRALEPESSGDYRLTLAGDQRVPLSRRFRSTLDAVRHPSAEPAGAGK